ncbi:MAG: ribosome maturation factor RimM [Gammaproteobacteria bacterium]|nr:ribosome maturation factor RimM [Gammaproteobacteria bacterium]
MKSAHKQVALGYISAVHGIKGWVKVHSWTRPMEAILEYQPWLLGEDRKPVKLVDGRKQGKGMAALLPGYSDREQAVALVGQQIFVSRDQMPPTEEDEYYWSDLEGLEVHTTNGEVLGRVDRMMETGANDVLVVCGDRERLVPFIQGQYVMRVDLEAGLIVVDWDPDF